MRRTNRVLAGAYVLTLAAGAQALAQTESLAGGWGNGTRPECLESGDFAGFSSCPELNILNAVIYRTDSTCQMENPQPLDGMNGVHVYLICQNAEQIWDHYAALVVDTQGRLNMLTEHGTTLYLRVAPWRIPPGLQPPQDK